MAELRQDAGSDRPTRTGGQAAAVGALLRRPGVLMGLVATTMLALGSLVPEDAALFRLPEWLAVVREFMLLGTGVSFLVVASVLLAAAWIELRPRGGEDTTVAPLLRVAVISTVWSLPLLVSLPVASTDAYLYLDQGW